ncbi:hypothetical protein NITHO_1000007 [Nitrolancea hollandica Lb]|uniref:Uncharacterized protein n=1 Tax=Nitrolancea hollandica Lb TaxID=1129897 RepID=I4EC92_9BACT|nr:hypothetical protein NITHO_1000007 [Nitrolancea hollandica Lb]
MFSPAYRIQSVGFPARRCRTEHPAIHTDRTRDWLNEGGDKTNYLRSAADLRLDSFKRGKYHDEKTLIRRHKGRGA